MPIGLLIVGWHPWTAYPGVVDEPVPFVMVVVFFTFVEMNDSFQGLLCGVLLSWSLQNANTSVKPSIKLYNWCCWSAFRAFPLITTNSHSASWWSVGTFNGVQAWNSVSASPVCAVIAKLSSLETWATADHLCRVTGSIAGLTSLIGTAVISLFTNDVVKVFATIIGVGRGSTATQWHSYSGALWGLCPTVSLSGPIVSKKMQFTWSNVNILHSTITQLLLWKIIIEVLCIVQSHVNQRKNGNILFNFHYHVTANLNVIIGGSY